MLVFGRLIKLQTRSTASMRKAATGPRNSVSAWCKMPAVVVHSVSTISALALLHPTVSASTEQLSRTSESSRAWRAHSAASLAMNVRFLIEQDSSLSNGVVVCDVVAVAVGVVVTDVVAVIVGELEAVVVTVDVWVVDRVEVSVVVPESVAEVVAVTVFVVVPDVSVFVGVEVAVVDGVDDVSVVVAVDDGVVDVSVVPVVVGVVVS